MGDYLHSSSYSYLTIMELERRRAWLRWRMRERKSLKTFSVFLKSYGMFCLFAVVGREYILHLFCKKRVSRDDHECFHLFPLTSLLPILLISFYRSSSHFTFVFSKVWWWESYWQSFKCQILTSKCRHALWDFGQVACLVKILLF